MKEFEISLEAAINAMMHGALEQRILRSPDAALGIVVYAAYLLAIETHGAGNEKAAIEKVKAVFNGQYESFDETVRTGAITGSRRGGFER